MTFGTSTDRHESCLLLARARPGKKEKPSKKEKQSKQRYSSPTLKASLHVVGSVSIEPPSLGTI
ncbi:MAG: hypothetical protein CMB97_01770 [Flavobacteriaceae bacterium]|nr:hypothetical protein [Flavobacteriaceae bacterium]